MPLTAAQIETLRARIGDALTFEDLDLVLRKCFGDSRINEVASVGQPQRIVAQHCIELAEAERITVVFLRYVLGSAACTAKVREEVIAIFPELRTADQPFAEIVSLAAGSLTANAARIAAQVGDNAPIDKLADATAELKCYKGLHEALHQIQINPRPEVPLTTGAGEMQEFRRAARQYVTLLRTARIKAGDALSELPTGSPKLQVETGWIQKMDDCATRIQAAAAQSDLAATELALDVTGRTLDPLPDEINQRIFAIVSGLPLDDLLNALVSTNPANGDTFRQAMDALRSLRVAVVTRVLEHSRWQDLDNGLFVLDQSFKLPVIAAFKKFARQWSLTRKQLQSLMEAERQSDWAVAIERYATEIEHALAEIERSFTAPASRDDELFNNLMFEHYDLLRQEARLRFFEVDSELKQNCLELSRIRKPLQEIKAEIRS